MKSLPLFLFEEIRLHLYDRDMSKILFTNQYRRMISDPTGTRKMQSTPPVTRRGHYFIIILSASMPPFCFPRSRVYPPMHNP